MLGLLACVIIGVVAAGAVGATAYAVYKLVTRDTVKDDVKAKLSSEKPDLVKTSFSAKVKEKSNTSIKVSIIDKWDEPLAEMNITGDEISEEIHVGDVILL